MVRPLVVSLDKNKTELLGVRAFWGGPTPELTSKKDLWHVHSTHWSIFFD